MASLSQAKNDAAPAIASYTVDDNVISHIKGYRVMNRDVINPTMKLWFEDEWEHMIDPPVELRPHHYYFCLPKGIDNRTAFIKMRNANTNFKMAKMLSNCENKYSAREMERHIVTNLWLYKDQMDPSAVIAPLKQLFDTFLNEFKAQAQTLVSEMAKATSGQTKTGAPYGDPMASTTVEQTAGRMLDAELMESVRPARLSDADSVATVTSMQTEDNDQLFDGDLVDKLVVSSSFLDAPPIISPCFPVIPNVDQSYHPPL